MICINNVNPKSVVEVGCGGGEILSQLSQKMPASTHFYGFDVSPDAIRLCEKINVDRIKFVLGDFLIENRDNYDLLLAIDVIEHLEDYHTFLREVKDVATYKLFHIPLEINLLGVLFSQLSRSKKQVGHLHFFTKDLALLLLCDLGYEIVDYRLTPGFELTGKNHPLSSKILKSPRKLAYLISEDATSNLLGGCSLMVLTK